MTHHEVRLSRQDLIRLEKALREVETSLRAHVNWRIDLLRAQLETDRLRERTEAASF
jgi:predicted DsbA family dithiol-disulfide isomerase